MSHTIISREQARQLALKLFFDGKPCRRGLHVAQKHVARGHCVECRREKAMRNKPTDLDAHRAYQRTWYTSNPDKVQRYRAKKLADDSYRAGRRVYSNAYYDAHPEKRGAWVKANPERARALAQARYNPTAQKRYRDAWLAKPGNLEKQRAACSNWSSTNPEQVAANARKKRARRRGAPGSHTATDIASIRKAQRNRCAYCRKRLVGREGHVDHKIALARGGTNDRTNLQICCDTCNCRKHAKDPIDFAREMGLLL